MSLLTACDRSIYTEHRQIQLESDDLSAPLYSGVAILEQSRVCADLVAHRVSPDDPPVFEPADADTLAACYEQQVLGPATLVDGCIELHTPGEVQWRFDRRDCALPGSFADDLLDLEVLPVTAVRGAFAYAVPWRDVELALPIDVEPPTQPPGYLATVGAPLYVVEETIDQLDTRVVRADAASEVGFTDARASAVAIAGAPDFADDPEPSPTLDFTARAGDAFRVALTLPAGELAVGDVLVVPPSAIAEVAWAPLVVRVRDTDDFLFVGAMAVAYDADGHVLREPEASWEHLAGDGTIEAFDFDEDGQADPDAWVNLLDTCEGAVAGERREATLRGRLAEIEGTVDVRWTCLDDHEPDGCGCRARPPNAAWWLVALVALRRRRTR